MNLASIGSDPCVLCFHYNANPQSSLTGVIALVVVLEEKESERKRERMVERGH